MNPTRSLAVLLLAAASCLRADYSYQTTTLITGGSLYGALRALAGVRNPQVTNNFIKGNRMSVASKDRTTVIDLDKETIIEIDLARKQYSLITFAQMRQAMEDAAGGSRKASFQVSAKSTGQTKAMGVLKAKETVLSMTAEAAAAGAVDDNSVDIVVDSWLAAAPGYEEVKEFHRKLGEKLGYAYASGMSEIAMALPRSLQGFAEVAREINKLEGVPVKSAMMMGKAGSPISTPEPSPSNSGGITGAVRSRLGGHKKSDPSGQTAEGSLVEATTEMGSFTSGPVEAAKFEVPAGFKKVDPVLPRAQGSAAR